ncbi:mechanosensitive ion channel family protein [Oceaniglobus indicus]|uniref:mechanosensitive ion channel family protein n=1 Tax=Oceaniglobus indicus TaxID=2047749 RepID=UPI000C19B699|nr:mechanosensitive ion channel domain-containing protein [Oceaniglobus indicus]
MELGLDAVVAQLGTLWAQLQAQVANLLLPSRLWQFALIAGCMAVAFLLARVSRERMRDWMRTLEGWPKWRLRILLTINKRLALIWFVALIWLATWIMQAIHIFPSRTFLLYLAASIATAWLVVDFLTRLVRHPLLRLLVRWGLWIWVTLYYLGLIDEASAFLDRLAINFGAFRLSALVLIHAAVVVAVLFTIARIITQTSAAQIRRNDHISPSMQVLSIKALQLSFYGAAFFLGLKSVGVDLTGLAVLSGAIGVGIGFGLQKVISNLVSGIILLLDKSIKPGDVISTGETFGWINALGARYVSITTRDGKEYLIPNEDLITGQVVNWSHSNDFVRLDIHFGCAYGDDPHLVRRVAIKASMGVDRVLASKPAVCHIVGFGDSSVDYILRFWIRDPAAGLTNIRGNVYLALWDAFRENGISIPFPQREVKILDDPASAAAAQKTEDGPG